MNLPSFSLSSTEKYQHVMGLTILKAQNPTSHAIPSQTLLMFDICLKFLRRTVEFMMISPSLKTLLLLIIIIQCNE